MHIVIVGGSLTGLINGIMLKKLGHSVDILEQSATSTRSDFAAGLGTGPIGRRFFAEHDSIEKGFAFNSPGIRFLDEADQIIREHPFPLILSGWSTIYYRLRALFDGSRSEIYPEPPEPREHDGPVEYKQGARVVDAYLHDEEVVIEFEDLEAAGKRTTTTADLALLAGGPYSALRQKFIPQSVTKYAGFVAFRGTVPEKDVSPETMRLFDEGSFNFFPGKGFYICGYTVPGANGSLQRGERAVNWVWYCNETEDSDRFRRIMTDADGKQHQSAVRGGMIDPSVWNDQRSIAAEQLDPAYLELVNKTAQPFVGAIQESFSPNLCFLNNKLLVVGDAATLMRPNGGMSFNSAATQTLLLRQVLQGKLSCEDWERECIDTSWRMREFCRTASDSLLLERGNFTDAFTINLFSRHLKL